MDAWVVVGLALLVVLVAVIAMWCTWTAGRLDRMHLRLEAAAASLEARLQQRSSVAAELATGGLGDPASALYLLDAAHAAREHQSAGHDRWQAESELTAALNAVDLPPADTEPLVGELVEASRGVAMTRRIHNDLAATTRALHQRRRVRWFRLAGHAAVPQSIDFDDSVDFG